MRSLSEIDRDIIRLANTPGFARWLEQIHDVGGCANPIYLSGWTRTLDPATGEALLSYTTADEPGERLAVRCGNRRASRCAPCSRLYQGDTFHLVRSGLSGGKGIPDTVAGHPRLFVTLTAPSFGPVHRSAPEQSEEPCRPRRDARCCEHGARLGCGLVHAQDDPVVGTPLCPSCYDYTGHVLWHAHAGRLWDRFTTAVRRDLAQVLGLARARLRDHLVVSFAKVAEYQRRGAIHFHAVVRLDGPEGPRSAPPPWVLPGLLEECIRRAAAQVYVDTKELDAYGCYRLRWGEQLDARPIRAFGDTGETLRDDAVAGYVAKYVTKSAEVAGAVDYPIPSAANIPYLPVSTHVRALVGTCWRLGGLPELEPLRLRAWAHMLGYRGHCLTKSRAYSTTYGQLRAVRAAHRTGPPLTDSQTVTESAWRYVGHGYTPGEAELAAGIAETITLNREIAREELARERQGGRNGATP
ncbi:replication initiator [Streptacidiphilus sp. MAP12-16]|uniref:replication initiator n=1 Tax=Streptacidiphilus sp. MAP12-16 TaxID=3156300 RepID=UPI003510FA64